MSRKYFLYALFSLHLLFYVLALTVGNTRIADSYDYLYQAENLRNSGSFYAGNLEEPIKPDYYTKRTPGYGVILYLLQSTEWLVLLLQNLMSILLWWMVFKLLLEFQLEEKKAAWLVLLVLMFQSNTLIYANSILAEIPFQFLLFLGFYFLYKDLKHENNWNWLLAGFIFAVALLFKPVLLFLWVPLLVYAFFRARQRRRFQLIWPVFFMPLTVLLWSTHNQNSTGWTHFSSISTVNIKDYNTRLMLEAIHGVDSADVIISELNRTAAFIPDYGHRSRFIMDTCKAIIKANKWAYAKVHTKGMMAMMLDPGRYDYVQFFQLHTTEQGFMYKLARGDFRGMWDTLRKQYFLTIFFFIVNLFGSAVLFYYSLKGLRRLPDETMLVILLIGLIAYFWILTGPVGTARYKSAILPFMVLLSGLGLVGKKSEIR
ncbi:MAG TPA: hypothetical protein DIW47_02110 [Bacteroidetes bacterium]|nr:hypothetical protein [Bacteroidota bacterium]